MEPLSAPIRAMIVDDEPLAVEVLESLLARHGGFEVVGRYLDPVRASKDLRKLDPDVLFLDVRMPRLTGTRSALKCVTSTGCSSSYTVKSSLSSV